MSSEPTGGDAKAPISLAGKIDQACDRFEAAWRSDQRPRIEDYLDTVPQAARGQLLRALLAVELELRRRKQQRPTAHEYRTRFPEYQEQIDALFAIKSDSTAKQARVPAERGDAAQVTALRVRCPHCSAVVEVVDEAAGGEVGCSSCGGSFNPADDRVRREESSSQIGDRSSAGADTVARISETEPNQATTGDAELGKPARRLGRFELIEEVGRGGFGVVYKARDPELNRTVALKLPWFGESGDEALRERFLREARSAAGLRHPNICPVHEAGQHEGQAFIAMGFIQGKTLKDWADDSCPNAHQVAEIVARIAQAVHYAHQRGVIHRDIKPANVMIDAETSEPVLMDFGLAKELGSEASQLTQSGDIMGTPAYMSPEQAAGRLEQIGPTTDVYSLGAVLYQLVTGQLPFVGSVGEVLVKVQSEEPVPLCKVAPRTHRDLETICLKALVKDPQGRYGTAAALAEDLQRFVAGESILARREGLARKAIRKVRRRPVVTALLAAALTVFVAGGYFGWKGLEGRRGAVALASVESGFDAQQWDAEHLRRMEASIDLLEPLDPARATDARKRLHERYAAMILEHITQPRLEAEHVASIEADIALLESRDSAIVAGLREELARRQSRWDLVFDLVAPFDNRKQVFRDSRIFLDGASLKIPVADPNRPVRRVFTRDPCASHVEIEAQFDPSWKSGDCVGLLLGATSAGEYSFVLRREEEDEERSPSRKKHVDPAWFLEITRNKTVLQRAPLAASVLGEGPLRIRARREGDRLSLAVNDQKPLEFEDMFAVSRSEPGVFGVWWPADVGLLRLTATRRTMPQAASPLEQGDELFAGGRFAEAMSRYEEVAAATRDAEFRQEAQFKSALCLVNLQRTEEAAQRLGQLTAQNGDRWPPSAGCQLWLLRLRQNKAAEAETVFQTLSGRFTFDQLASRIPSQVRDEILGSYSDQIASAESQLSFRPNMIRDMERLVAVEELLRTDGHARGTARMWLARAYEHMGDNQRAMKISKDLAEQTGEPYYVKIYTRLLRNGGDSELALREINRFLRDDPGVKPHFTLDMLLCRARTHAVMGDWPSAEADLEELLRWRPSEELLYALHHTEANLLLGFARQRLYGEAAALETWRTVLAELRPLLNERSDIDGVTLDFLIMASLADQLTREDADRFLGRLLSVGRAGSLASVFRTMVGEETIVSVLGQMWRTPRGRRWAEEIALRSTSNAEHARIPTLLAAMEFFRQRAFGGALSERQDDLVWNVVQEAYTAAFETGEIAQPQMLQLAFAWKGQTNWVGWASVAPTLQPKLRGPLAYVLAHRYLHENHADNAVMLLRTALEDAAENALLAELARTDLDLFQINQGRLLVDSDFRASLRLSVKQDDKQVATLDVDAGQTAQQTLDLPVGKYDLNLVDPPADVSLSTNRILVTPAGRHPVRVE